MKHHALSQPFRTLLCAAAFLHAGLREPAAVRAEVPSHFGFRAYSSEDGLDNQSTFFISQDHAGRLWVATEDGLYRYDGQRFKRFDEHDGLPSSLVRSVFVDVQGRVWAGTMLGVARLHDERFETLGTDRGLPAKDAVHFASVGNDQIWVVLDENVYRSKGADAFEAVPGWTGICTALTTSRNGKRIWAPRQTTAQPPAIEIWSYENNAFKAWPMAAAADAEPITAIIEDVGGRVWARSRSQLWLLEPEHQQFKLFLQDIPAPEGPARLALDERGQLLIPSGNGLHQLENGKLRVLSSTQGLPTAWVRHALVDSEGSLWIAGMGVYRVLGRSLWQNFSHKDGLPGALAWSVIRDTKGRLWIGTNRGLALKGENSWESVKGSEKFVVQSLAEAPDGTILGAGNPAQALRYNPDTGALAAFGAALNGVGTVFHMHIDPEQNVWLATSRAGAFRAHLRDKEPQFRFVELPLGAPDEMIINISQGQAGRLWFGGQRGLVLHEAGAFRRFTKEHGLLENHVAFPLEMRSGELVIAYANERQISHFRYKDGNLRLIHHEKNQARLARVFSLGEDARGALWLGTGRGAIVHSAKGYEHFTARDGLPSEDFNNSAFWADPNGDVWFGTSGGFSLFHGSRYNGPVAPPRVRIASAELGKHPLNPGQLLEVAHGENTFFTQFSSPSFSGEGKTQYQVRLSGMDAEYRITENREVRYPGLPPGHYVFDVKAQVGVGEWGEPTTLSFRILPAWYQTLAARIGFALSLIGLGWLGLRIRTRTLKNRNRALEAIVRARTRELRQASLTDPLTGLRNRRFLSEILGRNRNAQSSGTVTLPPPVGQIEHDSIFVLLDIDHFKSINDTWGHNAGDLVLKQLSKILSGLVGPRDIVARWGGEEFLILLRETPRHLAHEFVERARAAVEEHAFEIGAETPLHRTCSLGFAPLPFYADTPHAVVWEQVVNLADQCLYVAKKSGRNRWVGIVPPKQLHGAQPWPIQVTDLLFEQSPWMVMPQVSLPPLD